MALFVLTSISLLLIVSDFSYFVGPKPSKDATIEAEPAKPSTKPTVEQKLDDAVRDLKVDYLGKLSAKDKEEGTFDELYTKLETEYPDHLPLQMAKLKYVDTHPKRSEMLTDVIAAAEIVINRISEDELALNLGRKVDSEDGDAVKVSSILEMTFKMSRYHVYQRHSSFVRFLCCCSNARKLRKRRIT